MKTMLMLRAFSYHPFRNVTIQYQAGKIYGRVPEAAVRVILEANAGQVIDGATPEQESRAVQAVDQRSAKGSARRGGRRAQRAG
ncbi:hypothetical protein [Bradyrhizobium japonicum]|uniref:hypothetical protein n=1 Tax=Bradyrhizobium japonicum TaxID=375 RepID=UPI0027148E93|nr:hypothetical protein [Bradyrhizobium japonicum]WLB14988.1 hypothetical protein QIH95_23235 [Bradyrhizobium japonicum]